MKERYGDEYFREAPLASDEQLLLFHTQRHVDKFHQLSAFVEKENAEKRYAFKRYDFDTCVMWHTRKAALRAAGAMLQAVDDVFSVPTIEADIRCIIFNIV